MGPTGFGDSPYQSFSTFAGNPYFIDLEDLIEQGLLKREECDALDFGSDPERVDYGKQYENRFRILRTAYERFDGKKDEGYYQFAEDNSEWLEDYALFMKSSGYRADGSGKHTGLRKKPNVFSG